MCSSQINCYSLFNGNFLARVGDRGKDDAAVRAVTELFDDRVAIHDDVINLRSSLRRSQDNNDNDDDDDNDDDIVEQCTASQCTSDSLPLHCCVQHIHGVLNRRGPIYKES